MVQNPGDVLEGQVAELVETVVIVEDIHPVLGEEVVYVHPVPGLLRQRASGGR